MAGSSSIDGEPATRSWHGTGLALRACLQEEVAIRLGGSPRSESRLAEFLPRSDADAAALLQVAQQQGMLPLLAASLMRAQRALSAAAADRHAPLARLAVAAAQLRDAELPTALLQLGAAVQSGAALTRGGIAYAAVKGPVIGELAWGGWSRRPPAQDIDLLVAGEDLDAALEALGSIGFTAVHPLPVRARAFAMGNFGEMTLRRKDGMLLDLHWRLGMPYLRSTPPTQELLARRRELRLTGLASALVTIDPAETLLFLAVHGVKEGWALWRWTTDVALLLAVSSQRTMDAARALARGRDCEEQLLLACALVAEHTALPLAPGAASDSPHALALGRACAGGQLRLAAAPPWLALRSSGCWHDRIALVTETVRPWPVDWWGLDLPAPLWWLYWLRRPLRVAWKHLRLRKAAGAEAAAAKPMAGG